MKSKKSQPTPQSTKNFVFRRYRCEICGTTSEKPAEHCGYPMVDMLSDTCMACRACGHHF